MHWLQTRKLAVFIPFLIITFVILPICFYQAYMLNPYFPKWQDNQQVSWESQIGTQEFSLPNYLHAGTENKITVWCNVSSPKLVVNNYALIVVQVTVETAIYDIISIEVMPDNALRCMPTMYDDFPLMNPPTASRISMAFPEAESRFYKTYVDGDWVRFQASGSVKLAISLSVLPNDNSMYANSQLYNAFKEYFPDNKYSTTLVMAPVIQSGQTIQEQLNENFNQSLTYIVLALALVEVSVALFDHSKNKDKQKEYERIKKYKKRFDEADNY